VNTLWQPFKGAQQWGVVSLEWTNSDSCSLSCLCLKSGTRLITYRHSWCWANEFLAICLIVWAKRYTYITGEHIYRCSAQALAYLVWCLLYGVLKKRFTFLTVNAKKHVLTQVLKWNWGFHKRKRRKWTGWKSIVNQGNTITLSLEPLLSTRYDRVLCLCLVIREFFGHERVYLVRK